MKKRKFKKDGHGGFIIGTGICILAFVASLLIFSLILSFLENPIALISISALLSYIISGAVSAFINAKRKGEGGTLTALLSSLLASALFFSVGFIISRGKIELSLLMNIFCYVLVSLVFAKIAGTNKKRYKFRR